VAQVVLAQVQECDILALMANPTATVSGNGDHPSFMVPSDWVEVVATEWATVLTSTNPLLEHEAAQAAVLPLAGRLAAALVAEPFDLAAGEEVGACLEGLDSIQPDDLRRVQEALLPVLASPLAAGVQERAAALLFALGSGFFAAKAQRASALDMSAQSRMSHDLKTPINAITGFSRVILKGIDGPITDFQREDLTSIYEAGQRLLTMINDVFLVRKSDAARTLIYQESYDVAELLADVVRTAQPMAGEREHTFELRMVGDLGMLALDASMVRWILLSLVGYLIRRTAGSLIMLNASRDTEAADWLLFQIACRPPGGLRGYRDPLGELLRDNPESPGGFAWPPEISLMTCRQFCEELGGSVEVVRNETVMFHVRLPAVLLPDFD
jgi:signal transduction histidine kinase